MMHIIDPDFYIKVGVWGNEIVEVDWSESAGHVDYKMGATKDEVIEYLKKTVAYLEKQP